MKIIKFGVLCRSIYSRNLGFLPIIFYIESQNNAHMSLLPVFFADILKINWDIVIEKADFEKVMNLLQISQLTAFYLEHL